jgi:hypothetical protein
MSARSRFVLGALVGVGVLAVAGVGGLSVGSTAAQAKATPATTSESSLAISPIDGNFVPEKFSTDYGVTVTEKDPKAKLS